MRKNDLKVGVEYACFMSPAQARSRHSWSRGKPFKATLVALDFSEERLTRTQFGYGAQTLLTPKRVSGIAVDKGEKIVREGERPVYDETGHTYARDENRRIVSEPVREEYDYVLLENAGCFWMTWADYEKSLRDEQEWEERKQRQWAERRAQTKAEAPRKQRLVEVVVERLTELLGEPHPVASIDGLPPERVRWYGEPDAQGARDMSAEIDVDYETIEAERLPVRAKVEVDLETMARLLGVETEVTA